MNLYLGLVHYPIENKRGEIITTSVTNMDLHDIARSCRTYGMKRYFVVTPLEKQHAMINKISTHWSQDEANDYNPDRVQAFKMIQVVNDLDGAVLQIKEETGKDPLIVMTSAKDEGAHLIEIKDLMHKIILDKNPLFLLFGTGWGLSASVREMADYRLVPLKGLAEDRYNHLSVRSAVAIYLDRIAQEASELQNI